MLYYYLNLISKTINLIEFQQLGSRQFSNIIIIITLNFGSLGCFISSLSSFFKVNLFSSLFFQYNIVFLQDLTRIYYGITGLVIGVFFSLNIYWSIGHGAVYLDYRSIIYKLIYQQFIRVERKGFPGKNRLIRLKVRLKDINYLLVHIIGGLNPSRQLLILLKDKREIPLTDCEKLPSLTYLENLSISISKILKLNVRFK
tara:strand:- start:167 stop:766 length:600 start_codon:yes stop_codon:yes gene_type:complete